MRLLAIGHDASLTGAPLLLKSYLTAACKNNSFDQVRIALGSGGALTQGYFEIADTYVDGQAGPSSLLFRMAGKLTKRLGGHHTKKYLLRKWIKLSQEPDIIYVNTVAAIPLLSRILRLLETKPNVVIHVHELDWLLQKYETENGVGDFLRRATKVIVPCNGVAQALSCLFNIPLDLMQIIPEWVCRDIKVERYNQMRLKVRDEIGLEETDTLCIGVGTMQWRKGSDLLPLIASACAERDLSIHFAWIGSSSADELMQLKLDARKAGVDQLIHVVPEQSDPYPYYSAADLYILPSREDPYPVAMLEAGLFKLPVVCFENSGGASEYIGNGSGLSVPFLDIAKFARAIEKISGSPKVREEMGNVGRATVIEKHNSTICARLITETLVKAGESGE